MSIDKKQKKILQAIKLTQAHKKGMESFVLMEVLDNLEEKIENIPKVDLVNIENTLNTLTNKVNEDLVVELEII
jgi:hypothetical protein